MRATTGGRPCASYIPFPASSLLPFVPCLLFPVLYALKHPSIYYCINSRLTHHFSFIVNSLQGKKNPVFGAEIQVRYFCRKRRNRARGSGWSGLRPI